MSVIILLFGVSVLGLPIWLTMESCRASAGEGMVLSCTVHSSLLFYTMPLGILLIFVGVPCATMALTAVGRLPPIASQATNEENTSYREPLLV